MMPASADHPSAGSVHRARPHAGPAPAPALASPPPPAAPARTELAASQDPAEPVRDGSDGLQTGQVAADLGDASRGSAGRLCAWCHEPIPELSPATGRRTRVDAETCGVVCRKRRHRFLRAVDQAAPPPRPPRRSPRDTTARLAGSPGRFAYADPPYPGLAGYYQERQEVDHRQLIAYLEAEYPDGWALSTSAAALRAVLPLCPPDTRVCAWRRRVRVTRAKRALSAWEPLLVAHGRQHATDTAQTLLDDLETADVILADDALDYRGRYDSFTGALIGMKPPEFAVWLFRNLGARPGDTLDDLYPGSGAIGRAWARYTSPAAAAGPRDASPDPSQLERLDASLGAAATRPPGPADVARDASRTAVAPVRDALRHG